MKWTYLRSEAQLTALEKDSEVQAVLIYKHSNRCHVCTYTLRDLERNWVETYATSLKPYFVDVIEQRELSREIAARYGVTHESPQALVISNRKCVLHRSHSDINLDELLEKAAAA
jgi:bacillithiol system protein YtxJ